MKRDLVHAVVTMVGLLNCKHTLAVVDLRSSERVGLVAGVTGAGVGTQRRVGARAVGLARVCAAGALINLCNKPMPICLLVQRCFNCKKLNAVLSHRHTQNM